MKLIDKKTYEKVKRLKICLICGTGQVFRQNKSDLVAEEDAFVTTRELMVLLLKEGFKYVDYFTATEENLFALQLLKPDVFLNLTEGVRYEFCDKVYATLLKTKIPVIGTVNGPTTDKIKTKEVLIKNQIPTPKSFFLNEKSIHRFTRSPIEFPLIIKPALEDGSAGISDKSVVQNEKELFKRVKYCFKTYRQPILAEEYIDSKEYSVTFYQDKNVIKFLPVAELIFKPNAHEWDIYTFRAKWFYHSNDYSRIPTIAPPKDLNSHDEKIIKSVCQKAAQVFAINDFARIDFRFDEKNHIPYVIDVNVNPSLEIDKNYSLSVSVTAANLNMAEFTALIIKSALYRHGRTI